MRLEELIIRVYDSIISMLDTRENIRASDTKLRAWLGKPHNFFINHDYKTG